MFLSVTNQENLMKKKYVALTVIIITLISAYAFFIPRHKAILPPKKQITQPMEPIHANHQPSEKIKDLTTEEDIQTLIKETGPIVMVMHAPWCGACTYVDAYLPTLAALFEGRVTFYTVNTNNIEITRRLQLTNIIKERVAYLPTFLLMQHGTTYEQLVGAMELQELRSKIETIFNL